MATQKVRPDPGALDRQIRRQRRSGGTRKVGAFAVAASIVAIAIAVFALTRSSGDSTQVATRPPAVPVPSEPGLYTVNVATGTLQSFPDPDGGWFTTSPDGAQIAFHQTVDGLDQLFVMNADGTGVHQVTHDRYGASTPAWSPDGTSLAYLGFGEGARRNLFVLDLATGRSARITQGMRAEATDQYVPSWSPDGRIAYTTSRLRRIELVDPATGQTSTLLRDPVGAWDARWSPDGREIAYVHDVDGVRRAIWVMNVDGSGAHELAQSDNCCIAPLWSTDSTSIAYVDNENGGVRTMSVNLETGESTPLTWGWAQTWIGPDTLLVGFSPEDIAAASAS